MKSIAFLFYPKNFVFEENICENSTLVFHQKVYLFPISSIAFQFYPKNFVFGEDWREYLWKFNFCISQKVCFLYPTQPGEKMCSEGFVNKLSANCSPQVGLNVSKFHCTCIPLLLPSANTILPSTASKPEWSPEKGWIRSR